jgi:hypothetical protein
LPPIWRKRGNTNRRPNSTTVGQLLAQVQDCCDEGGFHAVREKFFPDLGRSRTFEILAIAAGKKSIEETRASTRERVKRHRARQESVTVTDSTPPKLAASFEKIENIEEVDTSESAEKRKALYAEAEAEAEEANNASADEHTGDAPDTMGSGAQTPSETVSPVDAYFATATISDIFSKLSATQRMAIFDLAICTYAVAETPTTPTKSGKKLLENLNGTLRWALGQDDPAAGGQALRIIKAKLAANKRGADTICFAFVKQR